MSHSTRVRIGETRDVFRLLNEVVDLQRQPAAGGLEAALLHAIQGVCGLVGARNGSAIGFAGWSAHGALKLESAVFGGWPNTSIFKAWRSGILPTDPRKDTIIARGSAIGKALVTRSREQIVSVEEWERSWEYEVLRDVDIGQHLCAWFRTDPAKEAIFSLTLHRPYGEEPFTVRQRNVLHLFNVELYRLFLDGAIKLYPPPEPVDPLAGLTARQREVLGWLLKGDGEKQIARRLGISRHTANDHVKAIHRKLEVSSRGELMARFVRPPEA